MEALDSVYWNKCIDKVMKEAEQYLIYDGIIAPPSDTSSTENVSEFVTISSQSNALSTNTKFKSVAVKKIKKNRNKIPGALRLKKLVVKQCTKDLISPTELSSKHGISIKTIQNWVSSSGATLPRKYKKRLIKVSIPTNEQPSCSTSISTTTFGDHSYTRTDFNVSLVAQKVKPDPCSSSISATTFGDHTYTRTDFNYSSAVKKVKLDPPTKKSLHCPIPMCKFETSRKNCLDVHIKSHVSCQQCGEVFLGKRQLAVHLTTHKQKKKQLFCEFCNREFKDKSNRWKHEKICKKRPESVKPLDEKH